MGSMEYQRTSSVSSVEIGRVYAPTNQNDVCALIKAIQAIAEGINNNQRILLELRESYQNTLSEDPSACLLERSLSSVRGRPSCDNPFSEFVDVDHHASYYLSSHDSVDRSLHGEIKKIKQFEQVLNLSACEARHLLKRSQLFSAYQNQPKSRGLLGGVKRIRGEFLKWRMHVHLHRLKNTCWDLGGVEDFLKESGCTLNTVSKLKGLRNSVRDADRAFLYGANVSCAVGSLHFSRQ